MAVLRYICMDEWKEGKVDTFRWSNEWIDLEGSITIHLYRQIDLSFKK